MKQSTKNQLYLLPSWASSDKTSDSIQTLIPPYPYSPTQNSNTPIATSDFLVIINEYISNGRRRHFEILWPDQHPAPTDVLRACPHQRAVPHPLLQRICQTQVHPSHKISNIICLNALRRQLPTLLPPRKQCTVRQRDLFAGTDWL